MGVVISLFPSASRAHSLEYQEDSYVRHAAREWQKARQAMVNYLTGSDFTFSTTGGMITGFSKKEEAKLLKHEQDMKRDFTQAVDDFARRQASLFVLSKSAFINILTIGTLLVWVVILVTSILPINPSNSAGKRDLVEVLLVIGEKGFGFAAVTARTYLWRVITFVLVAGYAISKKALEIHVDTAAERVARWHWSFVAVLVAKALEHLDYAVRLAPASKVWDFCERENAIEAKYLSVEQVVRRRVWASEYYTAWLWANYYKMSVWELPINT